ncbi:hypothetical protein PG994_001194 [Apiospora phragmitis]|uniref:Uncharacterized protein n=1 Tax=Apiospora phragmitis TaxID=2905665 RepID=A0ABR1WSV4_9PEZI
MSNKSVKYSDGSRPGHKGRHDHDSGVGSLSSEQASTGGRPDRRFTAEDIERQRRSPRALAEALRAKDDELLQARERYAELLADNRRLHNELKTYEKDWNALCDEKSTLQARVNALQVSNEQLSSEVEKLNTDNYNLKRRLGANVASDSDYTMSGGLGEGLPHSLRDRIKPKDEPKPSSKSHGRRRSMSSARQPYIEEPPTDDAVSRTRPPMAPSAHFTTHPAHYDNYTATTMSPTSYTQVQSPENHTCPEPSWIQGHRATRSLLATTWLIPCHNHQHQKPDVLSIESQDTKHIVLLHSTTLFRSG